MEIRFSRGEMAAGVATEFNLRRDVDARIAEDPKSFAVALVKLYNNNAWSPLSDHSVKALKPFCASVVAGKRPSTCFATFLPRNELDV